MRYFFEGIGFSSLVLSSGYLLGWYPFPLSFFSLFSILFFLFFFPFSLNLVVIFSLGLVFICFSSSLLELASLLGNTCSQLKLSKEIRSYFNRSLKGNFNGKVRVG